MAGPRTGPWRPARASASRRLTRRRRCKSALGHRWGCSCGDGDGEMALAGTGAADEYGVALLLDEGAAGEVSHRALVGDGAG